MSSKIEFPTPNTNRIIAVDLDGTLIRTDMLIESIFLLLRTLPHKFFESILWLIKGKAYFKNKVADNVTPSAATLPYNVNLLFWLNEQKASGASLILATASDSRLAHAISDHLQIFDKFIGTKDTNLAAENKRDVLVEHYGRNGFEYVGNSKADISVWEVASVVHVVNPERGVLAKAVAMGRIGKIFDDRPGYFSVLRKALRLHQWAKNLLVFVPLLAAHKITDFNLLMNALLAFMCFGACASSVYLLNDMLDLQDDRQHRTKRNRPLAAGTFPVFHAILWIPGLLVSSFGAALLWLPVQFSVVLLAYYALTLAYSLSLKRIVMFDVVALAMLYTVRVVAGAAATALATTFWILAFCMFIFLSLAFVKRYTELYDAREKGHQKKAPGRGYVASDFELLASLGGSAGYLSVLVLALYINDTLAQALYKHPQWLWAACPLLLFWLSRVWIIAHRGEMHDDPIVFALRDHTSRWVGICFFGIFALASF
nr:UbiA family prenyltransferase [uncultured Albidiferax sp.]